MDIELSVIIGIVATLLITYFFYRKTSQRFHNSFSEVEFIMRQSIRYPNTPIAYYLCPKCKAPFPTSLNECPKCGKGVEEYLDRQLSPVPWWGSTVCILIGIGAWIASTCLNIPGLDEAARAMVYIPLGFLFGMSLVKSIPDSEKLKATPSNTEGIQPIVKSKDEGEPVRNRQQNLGGEPVIGRQQNRIGEPGHPRQQSNGGEPERVR